MGLPYSTAVPKDIAEMTFHVDSDGSTAEGVIFPAVIGACQAFLDTAHSGGETNLASYLSGIAANTLLTKIYRYGADVTTPLGPPVASDSHTISDPDGPPNTTDLPPQLAVVTSWRGEHAFSLDGTELPSNYPPARKRGRMYFGPLNASALETTTGSLGGYVIVNATLRAALAEATQTLTQTIAANAAGCAVAILSKPFAGRAAVGTPGTPGYVAARPAYDASVTVVDNGWVDSRVDTQRRRELSPGGHTTTWG